MHTEVFAVTYQFPPWFKGVMYIFFVISAVTLLSLLLLAFDVVPTLDVEPLTELQPIRMLGVIVFFAVVFGLSEKLLAKLISGTGFLLSAAAAVFSVVTVEDYIQITTLLGLMLVGMALFYLNRKTSMGHASLQLQLLAFLSVIYLMFYQHDESMNVFMQAVVGVPYVLFYWVLMSASKQAPQQTLNEPRE